MTYELKPAPQRAVVRHAAVSQPSTWRAPALLGAHPLNFTPAEGTSGTASSGQLKSLGGDMDVIMHLCWNGSRVHLETITLSASVSLRESGTLGLGSLGGRDGGGGRRACGEEIRVDGIQPRRLARRHGRLGRRHGAQQLVA